MNVGRTQNGLSGSSFVIWPFCFNKNATVQCVQVGLVVCCQRQPDMVCLRTKGLVSMGLSLKDQPKGFSNEDACLSARSEGSVSLPGHGKAHTVRCEGHPRRDADLPI